MYYLEYSVQFKEFLEHQFCFYSMINEQVEIPMKVKFKYGANMNNVIDNDIQILFHFRSFCSISFNLR